MTENSASFTASRFAKTRLSEAEYQAFLGVLKVLGTTRSRMLRKMIRELIGWGPDLLADELKVFRQAVFQVGAIGRNLNQLVVAIHSGKPVPSQLEQGLIGQVKDQVGSLEEVLLTVVKRSQRRWKGDVE